MSKYFDAIDGLRAVAVGLVLLFHAGFGFAEGGFIGVDVFFVISGFLITGLIVRDIEQEKWSFSRFYLRRIARLTPALLVTLLATLIAAFFILTPDDLARLGRSAMYAGVSVSNFFFWLEAGYFDQSASSKALLHTWSLGVEEQFYVVWPAIIFLLARWRGRIGAAVGLAVLGGVSLVAALIFSQSNPNAVFFLMPFRVYQFALGGLVALLLTLRAGRSRDIVGFIALIILIGIAFSGDDGTPYLLIAVVPAIASAAFIWSAESKLIQAVFSSVPFKWLGQRSYSIYLMHWPIMVLWPLATDFDLSVRDGIIAIIASVIVGAILHAFIEKPFRFKRSDAHAKGGRSFAFTATLLICCTFLGAHFWAMGGMPGRVPVELRQYTSLNSQWQERLAAVRNGICNIGEGKKLSDYDVDECANPPNGTRSYMIIGDSYAAGAAIMLPHAFPEIYFGQLTLPGCNVDAPNSLPNQPKRPWCKENYQYAFELARQNGFEGVVISASWPAERNKVARRLVAWAEEHGLDLVLLSDRPRFKERAPVLVGTAISFEQAQMKAMSAENRSYRRRAYLMEEALDLETVVVNMHKVMCDDHCSMFNEDRDLLYLDASHVSVEGAKWFGARLKAQYPDLFQPPD